MFICRKTQTLAPEDCLRMKFSELERIPKAYSCIRYVGTKTIQPPTNFSKLRHCVAELLKDNSVRASRPLRIIYSALEVHTYTYVGVVVKVSFILAVFQTVTVCNNREYARLCPLPGSPRSTVIAYM